MAKRQRRQGSFAFALAFALAWAWAWAVSAARPRLSPPNSRTRMHCIDCSKRGGAAAPRPPSCCSSLHGPGGSRAWTKGGALRHPPSPPCSGQGTPNSTETARGGAEWQHCPRRAGPRRQFREVQSCSKPFETALNCSKLTARRAPRSRGARSSARPRRSAPPVNRFF